MRPTQPVKHVCETLIQVRSAPFPLCPFISQLLSPEASGKRTTLYTTTGALRRRPRRPPAYPLRNVRPTSISVHMRTLTCPPSAKRAETRPCPVCDEPIPLRLMAHHAQLEAERVGLIIDTIGSLELNPEAILDTPGAGCVPSSRLSLPRTDLALHFHIHTAQAPPAALRPGPARQSTRAPRPPTPRRRRPRRSA